MSNEITVKLLCNINKMCSILENKGFKVVDRFFMDDTYYIQKNIDIRKVTPRNILKNCILIRNITQYIPKEYNIKKMTYKKKKIKDNGEIIKQENISVEINSLKDGEKFLSAIGYKKLMNIKENDIVYAKNGFEIAIKDIIDGEKLIEIETNKTYDTINKLKQMIINLSLPIDKSNFFVKKAEIKLENIFGDYQ